MSPRLFLAKEAKISTPIWLWRREALVQELQPAFCCWSHVKIRCTVRQSLIFNKVGRLRSAILLKKRLWNRCFPANFVKFLRTIFLTEHLKWLLLCFVPLFNKWWLGRKWLFAINLSFLIYLNKLCPPFLLKRRLPHPIPDVVCIITWNLSPLQNKTSLKSLWWHHYLIAWFSSLSEALKILWLDNLYLITLVLCCSSVNIATIIA